MSEVTIEIPDEIGYLSEDLEVFFNGMVHKLYKNKHKKPPDTCDVTRFILLMQKEILELHEQWINDKTDPNLSAELWDIANFAFLMNVSAKKHLDALYNSLSAL